MEEETKTKVRSNAAHRGRWGKTRIVVTGGVGGIAGMVILSGALAVANMIKKRIPDTRKDDDVPESSSRDEGLPCLLPTSECIHDEIDHIGCHGEQDTRVRMPDSIQASVDIAAAAEENFLDKQYMEDEASVITNTGDIEEENHHVPIQEDEKVSSPPDQGLGGIEDESSTTHMESEIVDSPKEEDRSTNNGVIAPRTIADYSPDPDAVETPTQEDRSPREQLFCCTTEHEAVIMTQIDDFYPEPEMLQTPIKENGLDEHHYQVEEESSHEQLKIEPENLGAAGDVIKDEICVMVSQESSSVTCDCIKEETENEDGEDPSSPLKEGDEEMEDSEGTPDSSTESNSEAIWPVESKEDELLLSKLYKETSQNDVEEAGFVTTMSSDMELRSRPSKVFSRGGFLVWLLLVVGLMFLLFASEDLPISYPQLSSS